ncbi:MAG: AraC family transcriptional regulator [Prevotellaceae bacterium]|jgi:AraC-like DNA-binding protein|nr:AraC family transcriptional regulator [Prevotellaceae bacterium]
MDKVFVPRSELYSGDFFGLLRNPSIEFLPKLHYHDFYELQFYLSESGKIIMGDSEYKIATGDLLFINMFEPHQFVPLGNCYYERFSVCLDPSFLLMACTDDTNLLNLFDNSLPHYPIYHSDPTRLREYCWLLQRYNNHGLLRAASIYQRAIIYELLANLMNDVVQPTKTETKAEAVYIIAQILKFISEHLNDKLSLNDLTKEAHISVSYLCRIFKQQTGTTLKQYINLKRVETAKRLLREGASPDAACFGAGFNNYSFFFKVFKETVKLSPAQFQKKQCVDANDNAPQTAIPNGP